jgi:hypothetical protein
MEIRKISFRGYPGQKKLVRPTPSISTNKLGVMDNACDPSYAGHIAKSPARAKT